MGKFEVNMTIDDVKKYCSDNNCEFLSEEYKGGSFKYEFKCFCGNIFLTTFYKVKHRNKVQCNKCGRKRNHDYFLISYEEIKKRIEKNSNCTLLTEKNNYENTYSKILLLCGCGEIFETSYRYFNGNNKIRCNKCSEISVKNFHQKYSVEYLKNLLVENNLLLLDDIKTEKINAREKINVRCSCGKQYITSLELIFMLNKFRCNDCSYKTPMNEIRTRNFLIENNIKFKQQYKFEDCKYKRQLPFDFAIFDNDNLILLIENQGQQHYYPVDIFGGEEFFKKQQKRDNIKREYCRKNNIKLLEIPYYFFYKIENILKRELLI